MKTGINTLTLRLLAFTIFSVFLIGKTHAQTSILVTYYDGTEQQYNIANSGKLSFQTDNILVAADDASTATSIPLSIIRKITFTSVIVPLKLVNFSAQNESNQVTLSWNTENEANALQYNIERSSNGNDYVNIGLVKALNGSGSNNYSFVDASPVTGNNFYRLKQTDLGGAYTYSKILLINRALANKIVLLPNPANDHFTFSNNSSDPLVVKIYSMAGQVLLSGTYTPGESIPIGTLKAGMYMVVINNKPLKLIKQ